MYPASESVELKRENMADKDFLIRDVLFFIKDDLDGQITDPISSTRSTNSNFIVTSYPTRAVEYPIITIKVINIEAVRAGMQTSTQDITLDIEIRVWGRNQREKDEISTDVISRLADIQFTDSTGSIANNLHDLLIGSATEIDEPGEAGAQVIKSRIISVTYKFYDA